MSDYILPEVWENPTSMGGTWGGLNQPTAGARFEQTLPKGDQPFQLYTFPTPNGIKATIMLEELKELGVTQAGYDAYRIKIGDGDQFGSDFVAINPNSKIPAMMDYSETNQFVSLNQLTFSFTWLKNLANSFQLITQNVRKFSTGSFGKQVLLLF